MSHAYHLLCEPSHYKQLCSPLLHSKSIFEHNICQLLLLKLYTRHAIRMGQSKVVEISPFLLINGI